MTQFVKGDRVRMSQAGVTHCHPRSGVPRIGVVHARPRGDTLLILKDGRKGPERYHITFWELDPSYTLQGGDHERNDC